MVKLMISRTLDEMGHINKGIDLYFGIDRMSDDVIGSFLPTDIQFR